MHAMIRTRRSGAVRFAVFIVVAATGGSSALAAGDVSPSDLGAAWASHWAAQPIKPQFMPTVNGGPWASNIVDLFILEKLEEKGMQPSPPADRRTLIRRATYDLIGLPPSADEIHAFENDLSPNAFSKVVDQLLASPHYGERWGRHWLDVARYADTKGYVRLQEEPRFHYAYAYRDYVVRSFNEDLPYDRFLIEQIAADQIDSGHDNRALAGLGFLTLGRRYTSNKHDIIDDRIDVVTRGMLGLTVTCARCHDHKYDSIPIADYYSLYGVFAGAREPADLPLIGTEKNKPTFYGDMTEYHRKRDELEQLQSKRHTDLLDALRAKTTAYLLAVLEGRKPFLVPLPAETGEIRPTFIELWIDYIQSTALQHDPVFAPWHALAALDAEAFMEKARKIIAGMANAELAGIGGVPCNALVINALADDPLTSMISVARVYGRLLTAIHEKWQSQMAADPNATRLTDPEEEALRQVLYGAVGPFAITAKDAVAHYLYDAKINEELANAQNAFDAWVVQTGQAPDRAHILVDAPAPYEPTIFLRGNPERPGPRVPRRFLGMLTPEPRVPFTEGSGRLQLARDVASKDNPLTARVLVNRVWAGHFGVGLVTTPSNFGLGGEKPSHPKLLDELAWRFVEDGGSIKTLHRRIMLSSTYQQAGNDRPECRRIDPDNRWLWKMNRRRLNFEALRDTLLCVTGRLDRTIGGPSAPLTDSTNVRRTLYGTIDRLNMPTMLRTFDFPSPDIHCPQRFSTTVPQQALYLMNNPFVWEQAQTLVRRAKEPTNEEAPKTVTRLYSLTFGREPTQPEIARALDFITDDESWTEFAQVLLLSNPFMFVD
jgi:hypothetical protein